MVWIKDTSAICPPKLTQPILKKVKKRYLSVTASLVKPPCTDNSIFLFLRLTLYPFSVMIKKGTYTGLAVIYNSVLSIS
jgi:hypothetical protein